MTDTPKRRTPTRLEHQRTIDIVSRSEYESTRNAVAALEKAGRHQRLTRQLQSEADYANPDKWPLLFEARFAFALLEAGVDALYEFRSGVGEDSVDFGFESEVEWLVELVSPQTSDATIRRTEIADHDWGKTFAARPEPGTEAVRLIGKIIEKVADSSGRPRKFPLPESNVAHMIVVDTSRYLSGHADRYDHRELMQGSRALPRDFPFHTLVPGETVPIKGAFEEEHPDAKARHLRERVHFVSFIAERNFDTGEIAAQLYTEPNPHLFQDTDAALKHYRGFPLRRRPS